jgi:hypothetical protein
MSPTCSRILFFTLSLALLQIAAIATPHGSRQAAGSAPKPTPIATNAYEVEGVEVALLSVKRISNGSLTVTSEYRNTTGQPKRLGESFTGMGSSEAGSLVYFSYLADAKTKIEYRSPRTFTVNRSARSMTRAKSSFSHRTRR